jgi:hypothetical protein
MDYLLHTTAAATNSSVVDGEQGSDGHGEAKQEMAAAAPARGEWISRSLASTVLPASSGRPRMAGSDSDGEEVAAVLVVQGEVGRDEGGERVVVVDSMAQNLLLQRARGVERVQ